MNTNARFIEPIDVLFLRGNKLFGDPGSYGECLIPPWPSVAAGAIRSRMLVDDKIDLAAFGRGEVHHPTLGTPQSPGTFTLAGFYLARRINNKVEILMTPPADLVISESGSKQLEVSSSRPQMLANGLQCSTALPLVPVLAQGAKRSKSASGYWLTQAGWAAYLKGETPNAEQLVHSSKLWSFDARVGIGMSAETGSVEEGKLFSTQAVVMFKQGDFISNDNNKGEPLVADYDVGFLAVVSGAEPSNEGLLRLGGDGRAASIEAVDVQLPEPDYQAICNAGRCRIVLTSPGLFPEGWKLTGTAENQQISLANGIKARLVAAAVARSEVLSGWDLARKQPKDAQRIVPTGSVYWLDELQATPEALHKLVNNGLWDELCEDTHRKAEGFNRINITMWK